MLRLGDFDFEITTVAYQKYIAHHSAKWVDSIDSPQSKSASGATRLCNLWAWARWKSPSTALCTRLWQEVARPVSFLCGAVQTLADLSGSTDGTLTALVALALAVETDEAMLPIVASLISRIRHLRDAANLTRCGVDSDVQLLERTAQTFLAVADISNGPTETERRAVAETCRVAAEQGRTLMRSCEAICRCAETLLFKLSEMPRR